MRIEIVALSGIPEVHRGDDLASLIRDAAKKDQQPIDGWSFLPSPRRSFRKQKAQLLIFAKFDRLLSRNRGLMNGAKILG